MDHSDFDTLTRSMSGEHGTRRALLRLLAGGALGGLVARLGLSEGAQAKAKQKRKRRTPKAGHEQTGSLQTEGKRQGKKRKKRPKPPPLPPGCRACTECQMCRDGACVRDPALEGVRCLGSGAACGYCQGGQCAPSATPPCPDGSCPRQGQCCPGLKRCVDPESPTGFSCLGPDDCCPDQKRCGDRCIYRIQCCEADRPQCGPCEEAVCKTNGSWVCDSNGKKDCGGGVCVPEGQCCPEQWQCSDNSCVAQDECCPDERRCPDNSCRSNNQCCEGEKRCYWGNCVAEDQCCTSGDCGFAGPCCDGACCENHYYGCSLNGCCPKTFICNDGRCDPRCFHDTCDPPENCP